MNKCSTSSVWGTVKAAYNKYLKRDGGLLDEDFKALIIDPCPYIGHIYEFQIADIQTDSLGHVILKKEHMLLDTKDKYSLFNTSFSKSAIAKGELVFIEIINNINYNIFEVIVSKHDGGTLGHSYMRIS